MSDSEAKYQQCPECQATIPVHTGYVSWCDQCGWHVQPIVPERQNTILGRVYDRLGQRQSKALIEQLSTRQTLEPTLTAAILTGYVVAAAVHGLTLGLAVGGVILLVLGWPGWLSIASSLFLFGLAWVLRPRISTLPDRILDRARAPSLYEMVDAVAALLGTDMVYGIVLVTGPRDGFNASFARLGWSRRGILRLGAYLWAIMNDKEKIALVAHELAHSANKDPNRGFYIGTAAHTLEEWYAVLCPSPLRDIREELILLLKLPFMLITWVPARLAWLLGSALSHLLWRESQRAEYLADHLAATVVGTDAMLSLLDKLCLGHLSRWLFDRLAHSQDTATDVFGTLRQLVDGIPRRELDRIKRVQLLEMTRLDVTHPPLPYRIRLLQEHHVAQVKVRSQQFDFEQMDKEILACLQGR